MSSPLAEATVAVTADATTFRDDFREEARRAGQDAGNEAGRGLDDTLPDSTRRSGEKAGQQLGDGLGRSGERSARTAGERIGRRFVETMRSAAVVGLAGLGAQFVTSLAPATQSVALFPALAAVAVTAFAAVAVAIRGVSDAGKALADGDVEKYTAAMRNLSPAAQSVVREFAALRPEFAALRHETQNAFFAQLAGDATRLTAVLSGPLRAGMRDVADSAGNLASRILDVFATTQGASALEATFRNTGRFIDRLGPGMEVFTRGLLDFIRGTSPALDRVGSSISVILTRFGQWASEAANSGRALVWINSALDTLRDMGETVGDLVKLFAALAAGGRPLLFVFSAMGDFVSLLASMFSALPGPVQAFALALILINRTGVVDYLQRVGTAVSGQRSIFADAATAYRNTTTSIQQLNSVQGNFLGTIGRFRGEIGGVPSVLDQVRNSLDNLHGGMQRVATTAAGVGAAIGTGLRSAASGLVGFLGGPWGVAVAGATIVLGLFASAQAEAGRRTAEHKAFAQSLADTLDRQSGAVTNATRNLLADRAAREGWTKAANSMGISSETLVDALSGQAGALDQVRAKLADSARGQIEQTSSYRQLRERAAEYGITLDLLARSAAGDKAAQDQLAAANAKAGGSFNELVSASRLVGESQKTVAGALFTTGNALRDAAQANKDAAAAMNPAKQAAQQFNDALAILASTTADADSRARALVEALNYLAGGSANAEAAQARFNEILTGISERLKGNAEHAKGWGDAVLIAGGKISTTTANGQQLYKTATDLQKGMADAAVRTIEYGQATGTVDQAVTQVVQQVQAARAAFIAQAQEMGITKAAAEQLANQYGLIPSQVITQFQLPNYDKTQLELLTVQQRVKDIPPDKAVVIRSLSDEAKAKLSALGFQVNTLPDGQVEVIAHTEKAKSDLASLVKSWTGKVIDFVARVIGGNAIGGIAAYRHGGVHLGGRRVSSMSANYAAVVGPNNERLIGDRSRDDEAFIPINSSPRSRGILRFTARRMGYELVPLVGAQKPTGGTVIYAEFKINSPYSDPALVAEQAVARLMREAAA